MEFIIVRIKQRSMTWSSPIKNCQKAAHKTVKQLLTVFIPEASAKMCPNSTLSGDQGL